MTLAKNPESSHTSPLPPGRPFDDGHWAKGLAFGIGCIAMVIPLAFAVGAIASRHEPAGVYLGMAVAALFGLSQWLFVVPLGLYLRYRDKPDTAKGLWITAGVATLLNGACFGLMSFP